MFGFIARNVVRFRWLVIIIWLIAIPVTYYTLPSLSSVSQSSNSSFLPSSSLSQKAQVLAEPFQGKDTAISSTVVVYRDDGPLNLLDDAKIAQLETELKAFPSIVSVKDQAISRDGNVRTIALGFKSASYGPAGTEIVKQIRTIFNKYSTTNLSFHLGGLLAYNTDSNSVNNANRNNTQVYNVIFIIIILLLVYRALLAPFVTMLPSIFALLIASPIIAQSTKLGVQVSTVTELLLIVLLLGAGTDYGLFLVFRYREELSLGLDVKDAVVEALTKVGKSITFSAATVIAALMCLLFANFGFYKGLGPALSIGLAVMLLAGLTLLPATLAVLGKKVFWPVKIKVSRHPKLGIWGIFADKVIRKPYLTIFIAMIIFTALILGTRGWKTGGFVSSGPPPKSDSSIATDILNNHFPKSITSPQAILFKYDTSQWNNIANIGNVQSQLAASDLFKSIIGPIDPSQLTISSIEISKLYSLLGSPDKLPLIKPAYIKLSTSQYDQYRSLSQFISPDGKTIQFYGILSRGTPDSIEAANSIPAVRDNLKQIANNTNAIDYGVDSQDSFTYDINHTSSQDLLKIIPIVLLIIAILLAILLRSLVAPWYLVLTVALSFLASLGFANIVFVHLTKGSTGLNFVLPFLLFIFSMALGEDYNILVMTRIREEAKKTPSLKKAITKAIGVTGTTVTSAGLILSGTFIVLGVAGGSSQVQQIGFSIAFGIALDTFFVRTLLVPSIAVILGRWNWWPSKLSRKIPK